MSGLCVLGNLTWRINPDEIQWNFDINTNVVNTVGGRVVQVTGATLADITIHGFYGEDRSQIFATTGDGNNLPGMSWRMAEAFVEKIHNLMLQQSPPAGTQYNASGYQMPKPIRFMYPPKGWDFMVYVKEIADGSGVSSISHETGKFSYEYNLTLFPVKDNTYHLVGDTTILTQMKNAAITTAVDRISDGIGWKKDQFNDPQAAVDSSTYSSDPQASQIPGFKTPPPTNPVFVQNNKASRF